MMLLKCSTQYASKFGKLSNGHRTGKDQFSLGYSKLVHWDNPEGRDGEEVGKKVGGGLGMVDTCIPVADSCQCMEKTTTIL